jgi:signal transduction histidine kinase
VVLGSIWKIKQSSDPIARQVADTIERNAKAQVRTIDDLLYVSEALAGHRRLEFSPVDLEAICVSSAAALREDAWRRTITIAVIAPEQRAIVLGDPEPLRRTVTALVSNAVKFSNAGSSVEIALAVAPSQIDVMVTDSGIGMAPEVLKAIFEPFWQADSSTTRSHGGLGLGLTAAREVAAQHGGVISARSEGPGRGARFTLTLPRSRESLNEDAPALQRA